MAVVKWYLFSQLISFSVVPILYALLPNFPDRGYSFSKVFGFVLTGYLTWLLASLGILPFSALTFGLVVLFVGALSFAILEYSIKDYRGFFLNLKPHLVVSEGLVFFGFLFYVFLRYLTPEIYWGEKPMDFSFLNYFVRVEHLPPQDPWSAGNTLNYYYLGTFIFAALHKLSGVGTNIGYNLSIATVAVFSLCAAYGVLLWITRSRVAALAGTLMLNLSSNFELLNLAFFSDKDFKLNFDLFWAATRLFTSPAFAEYPLWSLLFADLHAHVIAVPFTILLLGLNLRLLEHSEKPFNAGDFFHLVCVSMVLACLFLTNSWDFISYSFVTGIFLLVRVISKFVKTEKRDQRFIFTCIAFLILVPALSLVWISPFLSASASALKPYTGWVASGEFNDIKYIFRHLGQWLIIIAAGILIGGLKLLGRPSISIAFVGVIAFDFALVPLALGLFSNAQGIQGVPWEILTVASVLCLAGFFLLGGYQIEFSRPKNVCRTRIDAIGLFLLVAGVILSCSELFFMFDRMNTIFKLYSPLWTLLGLSSAALLFFSVREVWTGNLLSTAESSGQLSAGTLTRYFARCLSLLLPLVVLSVACGGLLNVWIMSRDRKIEGPRPTLDGTAYLAQANPEEARLFAWMNSNIAGVPVVLEAHGPSYQSFTRVAMHTGLPTVLGWDYHVQQRGTPQSEIQNRKINIRRLYLSPDLATLKGLIEMYNVRYIVVGRNERELYYRDGNVNFDKFPEQFPVLFREGQTTLYGVDLK